MTLPRPLGSLEGSGPSLRKKLVLRWITFTQTWCLLHEASSDSPNMSRVSSYCVFWGPVSVPAMSPHHPLPYMNQDFRYTSCLLFSGGCFCFVLFALVEEIWLLLLLSPCHITILGQHRALILLINIFFYSYSLLSFPSRHRSLFYCGNGHLHLNVFLQNVHCWFICIYFKSLCERYYALCLILCPYLCVFNVVLCDI